MKKNDIIRIHPPDQDRFEAPEEKFTISYAMIMWKLQELCGLTYKEARAHLLHYRETEKDFAEDLNITVESVRKLKRRAAWKVRSSGSDLRQIAGKYDAVLCRRTIEPMEIPFDNDAETGEAEKVTIQSVTEGTGAKTVR